MSQEKNKPVLDEQTLAKLLEAAYVLQEHNREMRELELCLELKRDQVEAEERAAAPKTAASNAAPAASAPADYTLTLARIVETQHHIQVRRLDLASALLLVAERVVEIAHASGAAVGILDDKNVVYRAVAGGETPDAGVAVAVDEALCLPCIKTSQVLRCPDINAEFLLDPEECKKRGIQSLIAVPIFHEGGVAGALELYYPAPQAFTEQDVHTGQLMAGLVTEALVRDEELTWKKSLASERAAMLEALEKLQPNLAALVGQVPNNGHTAAEKKEIVEAPLPAPVHDFSCRKCGNKLVGEEMFCGQCGSPRNTDYEAPSMQSKLAVLWEMQEAQKKEAPAESASQDLPANDPHSHRFQSQPSLAHVIEEQIPELFRESELPVEESEHRDQLRSVGFEEDDEGELATESPQAERENEPTNTALTAKTAKAVDWSSAASAREFLDQLVSKKRSGWLVQFWNTRRGDIYLGIAIVLVLCVIRWGIFANHAGNPQAASNPAAAHHKSPEADLSFFDRMLIGLGLAEPPPVPEDKGNPSAQVWEDQKTGLYYCAGSDLYGKSPKGKYTTQRDAQLDQFEPAYRKPCN